MKKFLIVALLVFFGSKSADTTQIAKLPREPFTKLLDIFSLSYTSLEQVVRDTQKTWLRPTGKERWESPSIGEDKREEILTLCDQLGLIKEITPQSKYYDYILILGATLPAMQARIATYKELVAQEISCKTLIFLTGHRALTTSEKEQLQALGCSQDLCATETDMIRFLLQSSLLDTTCTCFIIDTPEQITATGKLSRPTTADTIKQWLAQESPEPGTCLCISDQPYCNYQHIVCASYLPKSFTIETVGKKASDHERISTYLDTIARTLYQYQIYLKCIKIICAYN